MINIYNYHNKIIYTSQTATSMIEAVEEAVKKGINLSGARLSLSLITIVFCLKNGIDYCEKDSDDTAQCHVGTEVFTLSLQSSSL